MKKLLAFLLIIVCLTASCFIESSIVKAAPSSAVTIRIMSDGHVEGTDKIQVSGNVYTLTDDINDYLNDSFSELHGFMIITKSGIIIDGAGHTIQGNGTGVGIYLRGMHDVTIENLTIRGFTVGISTYILAPEDMWFPIPAGTSSLSPLTSGTNNNQFINNNIEVVNPKNTLETLAGWGIYLEFASNTLISGNTIKTQNPQTGVFVGSGFGDQPYVNTTFVNNKFAGCGLYSFHINEIYACNNTIDGKPLAFFREASNEIVDGAGQVFLYNCANISVRNVQPNANYFATIQLEQTTHSEIINCGGTIFLTNACNSNLIHGNSARMIGLFLGSNYNEVFDNDVSIGSVIFARALSDYEYSNTCIKIEGSSCNEVFRNNLSISNYGIWLDGTSLGPTENNNIYLNNITKISGETGSGIYNTNAVNNTLHANSITNCVTAISFTSSSQYTAFQNTIINCNTGISIWQSSSNTFYSNNFLNNTHPVYESHYTEMPPFHVESTNNNWYDSVAKRGNYWSDYNGTDSNGDGVGDTPYHVFENYQDPYPLMEPFGTETNPPTSPLPSSSPSQNPTSTPEIPLNLTPTSTSTSMPSLLPSPSPSPSFASPESPNTVPSQNSTPTPKEQESTQNTDLIYAIAATAIIMVIVVIAVLMLKRRKQ